VNPCDERALTDALEQLLTDAALRADLRTRGLLRAAAFSWDRAARSTLAVYQEAITS
jgi:glycosyltransferase involved in cell wall biosynthesis